MSLKACRLTKEGSRKWTRAGFAEPSARTKQPSSPRGRLDRVVDLAGRDPVALGDELEVVDQRLHRGRELRARRQHVLAVVGDERALGQRVERLLDDPRRLDHLRHPHPVAVVVVADRADRDLEVDLRVGEVVEGLAQVPGLAGGAQQRPGHAQLQQPLARDDADALGPLRGRPRCGRAALRTGRPGPASRRRRRAASASKPSGMSSITPPTWK